jgi:glycosyltransferase involved in cell wall biosynthesis
MNVVQPTSLSIVIPAHNEERTIYEVLLIVAKVDTRGLKKEIILVDDGSTDNTLKQAREAREAMPDGVVLTILELFPNRGKGAAVKEGFAATTGDLVIVQDADMEYDPSNIGLMIDEILKGRADVVMGSRFIGGKPRRVIYLANAFGNRIMSGLFSLISGLPLTDIHCCYMLFPGTLIRGASKSLTSDRWGFNPEICSLIADWRDELSIVELGISYYGRSKQEGKQIRMRHGVVAIAEILKFNLRPPLPIPPGFISTRGSRALPFPSGLEGRSATDGIAPSALGASSDAGSMHG